MEKSICLFLVCILVAGILNGCAGDALSTEGQSAASTQSTNSTQQQPPTSTGGTEPTTPPTEPIRPTDSTAPTAPETQPAQLLTVQPRICIWDLSEEELERIDRAKKYYPWGEDFLAHMPDLYVYAIFGDIYVMEELRGGYDDAINREFGYDWMFVHPSGPYFPGYALTTMLGTMVYALFLYRTKVTIWRIFLAKLCNNVINVFLGSLWSTILYSKGYFYYVGTRVVTNGIMLPIQTVMLTVLFAALIPSLIHLDLMPGGSNSLKPRRKKKT